MSWDFPLPLKMQENINDLQSQNPDFELIIYDDEKCIEFFRTNFPKEVLIAYESLIPWSFKVDLWRFCILYIYGGIYIDIKMKSVNDFKFSSILDKEYYVSDGIFELDGKNHQSIYTALIVSKKNNIILLESIINIVYNVSIKFYGTSPWIVTGLSEPHKNFI